MGRAMIRAVVLVSSFFFMATATVSAQSPDEMRAVLRERLSSTAQEQSVEPELYEQIIEGLTQRATEAGISAEAMRDVKDVIVRSDDVCLYCVFFENIGYAARVWWIWILGFLSMILITLFAYIEHRQRNLQIRK